MGLPPHAPMEFAMNGLRSIPRTILFAVAFALTTFVLTTCSRADSPDIRAARLTFLQGAVTVSGPDNPAGVAGQLNLPLLSGVQIATGADGQAEIEFEDGSVIRLTPNSALSLDNLAVDSSGVFTTDVSLLQGLAYAELRAAPQYRYSINTGGDILTPIENVTVRINFDQPPAVISVLDGTAQVNRQTAPNTDLSSGGYQTDVRAGESLRDDPSDQTRYFLTQGVDPDTWDQWNADMDQAAASESADSTDVRNNYAGAQGYGWSDLDADGTWYNLPGDGPVWQPQVAADDPGFDPYGNGEWVSYSGGPYLWASAYSWGWTPYRCGNWSYFNGFGWGWAPGASCGGFGWGFVGGGRPVNITVGPPNYRPIRVPAPGHGPERPLIPVRTTPVYEPGRQAEPIARTPRQIAGVTAAPIQPAHRNTSPSGEATGAALQRDFAVDSKTHAPVAGLASTRPAIVQGGRSSQSPAQRIVVTQPPGATAPSETTQPYVNRRYSPPPSGSASSPAATTPPASTQPNVNRRYSPQAATQPPPSAAPAQRPAPQSNPVQRSQSPAQPTQPVPQRQTYTPPPSPPVMHPTYAPPPPRPSSPPPASSAPARNDRK